jgi:anti-anti-sigma regulatory factor
MTVRITRTTTRDATTVVVEGRLTAAEVESLKEACGAIGDGLRLELSGLRMADDAGIEELRRLSEAGAELSGASLFIRQLLNGGAS